MPSVSGLETLRAARRPARRRPAVAADRVFEYLDTKTVLVLLIGLGGFIGWLGVAWSVGFLGVATRARTPTFRKFMIYVPIVGGVVLGVSVLMSQIGSLQVVSEFLDADRTVKAATDADNSLIVYARLLYQLGTLALAVGLVLVALNALRIGLLTRMLGYIGIASGAMMVLFPLPIVQIFWLGAFGFVLLGRWPGGELPAWGTGEAVPWPTPSAAAQARGGTGRGDAARRTEQRSPRRAGPRRKRKKRYCKLTAGGDRMATEGQTLEDQLEELLDQETFPPPDGFKEQAVVSDAAIYEQAEDYEAFWAERAEALHWDTKWDQVLDWSNPPFAKWFVGGKLNVSYNCVDRHVEAGNGDRVAYHWRGEEGEELDVTYADLHRDVQKFANALKDLGVEQGRRRRDLPADDPRGRRRDARLRAHRRDPQRRLRRLQRRVGQGADRVLRGEGR